MSLYKQIALQGKAGQWPDGSSCEFASEDFAVESWADISWR